MTVAKRKVSKGAIHERATAEDLEDNSEVSNTNNHHPTQRSNKRTTGISKSWTKSKISHLSGLSVVAKWYSYSLIQC